MKIEEKLKLYKDKGFYLKDGEIYSHKNHLITSYLIRIVVNEKQINILRPQLVWYFTYNEIPVKMYYKDKNRNNCNIDNLSITPIHRAGRKKKPNKVVISYSKVKEKPFLNDIDLLKEIIVSKGKGQLTNKCEIMLILIVNKLISKFRYQNIDDRLDCKNDAILKLLSEWKGFNEYKYEKALPYFTELAKRSMANCYNQLKGNQRYNGKPRMISISNWKQ